MVYARPRNTHRLGGFTLIEVLVALVVLSTLAGLSWQAVDAMVRTRAAVEQQSQRLVVMGTALAQWEQDLQGLLVDGPLPALHFDGARLRLVRRAPGGVQLVVWSWRQGVWQRWAAPPTALESTLVQTWAQVPQMLGTEPGHITLAEGVTGWQLYFFRGNAWSNAQSSGDLVNKRSGGPEGEAEGRAVPSRERLPQGVRLVLALQGPAGAGTLRRDVLVPGGQP
ncbi:MAG: prepilin-type N-terminal cleavage/methylation domain-containing protein [Betaproteobacteria bacterium]|jgi:general secretion pathway protein J|nr:prepilin-type N-terminal cleavage/methylation domain-containing protein [Betaproteobacteria bacterium]NBT10345.1 prepilin-type N-terminal cleavage/methylation domain-containing protein [Betaproteobacteria bacterium]NBU49480.1 prepilin-type N-terminal cleavage/methylation domain-containing protein [Betaproteobacteria bacterium]NBX96763.1 prepilin-type N-terminal cleavage/methylation domain-containing protein [Betaproteobacteria bacterium]